jgi:hypothetical protein
MRITITGKRVIAAVLALSAAWVGPWAEIAPRSFYTSFPLGGRGWLTVLGPYNEHLTRDVGGLYLALLVMSCWAAVRPRAESFAMVGAGWLAFGVPHLIFHMLHLDGYTTADKVGNVGGLGGTVLLAALLLVPAVTQPRPGGTVSAADGTHPVKAGER